MNAPTYVFPQDISDDNSSTGFVRYGGMELRDYFAAQAMTAAIALAKGSDVDGAMRHAAELSFKMADAMVKARDAK